MDKELISVIMSTYNETLMEVRQAVESILSQTYQKIELIIISDNPKNLEVIDFLKAIKDNRVKVFYNEQNMGLVGSLNKALRYSKGNYIARMDSDDIAYKDRLEKQLKYMKKNDLSIVGGALELINENGNVVKNIMKFPTSEFKIKKCILWGSCIAHPTWLVKKNVYSELGGYREIAYCEDYDFLLRAIYIKGYSLGNVDDIVLKYRIRQNSISNSNNIDKYLVRRYLMKKRKQIQLLNDKDILEYRKSDQYIKDRRKYVKYIEDKKSKLFYIIFNKYFYLDILEKVVLKWREI